MLLPLLTGFSLFLLVWSLQLESFNLCETPGHPPTYQLAFEISYPWNTPLNNLPVCSSSYGSCTSFGQPVTSLEAFVHNECSKTKTLVSIIKSGLNFGLLTLPGINQLFLKDSQSIGFSSHDTFIVILFALQ